MGPADWHETPISETAFTAALTEHSLFGDSEEDVVDALRDAEDFLALAKQASDVVLLKEGYDKLQAAALERQLPPDLRGDSGLPKPPQLLWQPFRNLLHPQQLLARELTGRTSAACTARQPLSPGPVSQLEAVPFAVVERCKLLEVQYLLKELHQQTDEAAHIQQQQQQDTPQLPVHQQVWGAAAGPAAAQQPPLCRRLSVRVVLQRLAAEPLPDADPQLDSADDSSWQRRGLQGCGDTQHVAYTCTLEYPAFTIASSDYLVPAESFYKGLSSWQALQKGESFFMPWDGRPWRGFALGYRQRRPGDPYVGSPWWSISVEWEDHNTDRKRDPEDFLFANPWEMAREAAQPPQLPDAQAALAALSLVGHPVLAAPWTTVWAAAAAEAAVRAQAKRKRQSHHHDDEFLYEDAPDEEAALEAADLWDPTDFYYDDDPEEYELDLEECGPRRKSSRRQQQQQASGRRRSASRRSPLGSAAAAACCSRQHRPGAAAAGDLTHNYGRELLARSDVCLVCGSAEGSLVSGHTGRSGGTCSRHYHAGCLLLLNAIGIRSVMLAKSPQQPRKRSQASSSRRPGSGGPATAGASAQSADDLCDGLLGLLWQQSQQPGHQLGPAVVAAVAAAREASGRVAAGELALICPSHGCHGCRLNGKLEFMVWCCCCWVRVYHHRQCVPYGAEHVKVEGRDYIRCPHCRAAGVPVPSSAAAAAAGPQTRPAADAAGLPRSAGERPSPTAEGAGSGSSSRSAAVGDAADAMQADQGCAAAAAAAQDASSPSQQQQQSSSTLQGMPGGGNSSGAAAAGSDGCAGPPAAPSHEVVELLDSSEPCDADREDSGPEVIMLDSSEPEPEQQQHQQQPQDKSPEQMQGDSSAPTVVAAAAAAADDDADDDLGAMVAALDEQLAALRQAAEQRQQREQQFEGLGPTGHSDAMALPAAGASAGDRGPAADGSAAFAVAAAEPGLEVRSPCIPAWLQLALQDRELVNPSYMLVPCGSSGGAHSGGPDPEAVSVLAAAAAAAGTLPPLQLAAAGGVGREEGGVFEGLRLSSPHSHWLIGCVSKAEAHYKPANIWGCAMISVPLCPDDSVYGLAVVLDFLPSLQQQQQQQQQTGTSGQAHGAAAAAASRARPSVFLRCSKAVAQSGELQPALHARSEDERRQGREWQVLVNGQPYPARTGRSGVALHVGDTITVQGLTFKLQLAP